jgi:hypothetical protein
MRRDMGGGALNLEGCTKAFEERNGSYSVYNSRQIHDNIYYID